MFYLLPTDFMNQEYKVDILGTGLKESKKSYEYKQSGGNKKRKICYGLETLDLDQN